MKKVEVEKKEQIVFTTMGFAVYVKLCDRLANAKYSKQQGSKMIEAYRKEHKHFMAELSCVGFQPMWDELSELLSEPK